MRKNSISTPSQPTNPATIVGHLADAARDSAEYSKRHLRPLALLCIAIPFAYLVDLYVGKPEFDTLFIRVSAFMVVIPLMFHDSRFMLRHINLPAYFVFAAAYVLPFTFGTMLVMNAALSPPGVEIEMLWILQYFISLFLFIQIVHNGYLATSLWLLSSSAALLPLVFLDNPNIDELKRVLVYPVSGYFTALLFGVLTNRNADFINREKLKAASAIGAHIAHELRTPLASIGAIARANQKQLRTLTEGYIKAVEAGVHSGEIPIERARDLGSSLSLMQEEVEYSNTIIDMLLLNTRDNVALAGHLDRFAASDVVQEAIRRFPFNNSDERRSVTAKIEQDFEIEASRLLIIHVLFNLLKNGIYYMQSSPSGHLVVATKLDKARGCIEVTDTGPGIAPGVRRRIFDRFFTTTEAGQGAGIGLSFCKMVMEGIGGEIQCDSREGEYTTFRLLFPEIN